MAIRDFKLDPVTGDLAVENADFGVVEDLAAVLQGIPVRVKLFLGEAYLNELKGVDWLGQILVKNPNPVSVRELIRDAILETPDVTEAAAGVLILHADRKAEIGYTVRTVYGSETISASVTTP